MDTKTLLLLVGGFVGAQSMPSARADEVPFTITTKSDIYYVSLLCEGPSFRSSRCVDLSTDGEQKTTFYSAEVNIFSPFGGWRCNIFIDPGCVDRPDGSGDTAQLEFCLYENIPDQVDLVWDGRVLSGNVRDYDGGNGQDIDECSGVEHGYRSSAFLGHDGEDAAPRRDQDSYDFAGIAGEKVALSLDRDGGKGSVGAIAILRVLDQAGGELARRRGALPLELRLTLPGPVQIVVQREAKTGDSFRGGYQLTVKPTSGHAKRRVLLPRENVEH